MIAYLFDLEDHSAACTQDMGEVMARWPMRSLPVLTEEDMARTRKVVSVMLTYDLVLVPDDISRHTPAVRKAMDVARRMGMQVKPFREHLRQQATNPAAASAAPQQRPTAAAGNSSAHA